jgi:hypothetical protein
MISDHPYTHTHQIIPVLDADNLIEYRLEDQTATLTCNTNKKADYCWFMHPTGDLFFLIAS